MILLAYTLMPQLILQETQRRSLFGYHHQPRGIPVQPVDELQKTGLGSGRAQYLYQPETQAATAMHGNTRRFVNHQHLVVLEHNSGFHNLLSPVTGGGTLRAILLHNRRNAHDVAGLKPGIRPDTALVNPHLTLTDNAIDNAPGHTPQAGQQKVIHALPRHILVHTDHLHPYAGGSGRRRRLWPGRSGGIFWFVSEPRVT